jgi:hypothetical protein
MSSTMSVYDIDIFSLHDQVDRHCISVHFGYWYQTIGVYINNVNKEK